MGIPAQVYRLTVTHRALSASFGILEVVQAELREGEADFAVIELDEEQMLLPLTIEYLRVPLSPVFVHEGSSLAFKGSITPEFTLMLSVYDFEGRPEEGHLSNIYDHLDKKKLIEFSEDEQ